MFAHFVRFIWADLIVVIQTLLSNKHILIGVFYRSIKSITVCVLPVMVLVTRAVGVTIKAKHSHTDMFTRLVYNDLFFPVM